MKSYRVPIALIIAVLIIAAMAVWAATPRGDIATIVSQNKQFSTLAKAIDAAGLTQTLKGPGPFTVFAPTNAAFQKLPKATLESLLRPENKAKLRSILLFHVVKARVTGPEALKAKTPMMLKTLEGRQVEVMRHGNRLMVGKATVTGTDIMASNGVIHVIDQVLLPPAR